MCTVFSKKATIRFEDKRNPTKELDIFLNSDMFRGINYITLKQKNFQNELDVEFVCSNLDPTDARTEEDIDKLLTRLHVVKDKIKEHPNDPLKANNHLMEIQTNLDNPNIPDKLRSKAKLIHEEEISKQQIRSINEGFEQRNKKLAETSKKTKTSDFLKPLDEGKRTFRVGQVERG